MAYNHRHIIYTNIHEKPYAILSLWFPYHTNMWGKAAFHVAAVTMSLKPYMICWTQVSDVEDISPDIRRSSIRWRATSCSPVASALLFPVPGLKRMWRTE